ncbi:MAG: PDZ domain-containing protein [Bacilli bacterium]
MIKQILNNLKKIIIKNIKFLIFIIFIIIILTIKLPYYIETPGGVINVYDKFTIENYEVNNDLNLAYVSELRATIPTFILSKLLSNWDLKKIDTNTTNLDLEQTYFRDRLLLEEANDKAIMLAYQKANKSFTIDSNKIYITYIYPQAITNLEIGDQIISINETVIKSVSDITDIIENLKIGDTVNIDVISNNKITIKTATLINYKSKKMIGIVLTEDKEIISNPTIEINFSKNESGSSGGLMMTLAIYTQLTNFDLSKLGKIVGTGTISDDGTIGQISGLKYKIAGAVKEKTNIFIVPLGNNYNEAIQLKKDNDYDIEIIGVSTFDEVIDILTKKIS